MKKEVVVIILAAGKSSRMGMSIPKILIPVGGRPMISSILDVAKSCAKSENIYVVVSETVKQSLEQENVNLVVQDQPLGTGHAFSLAFAAGSRQDPHISSKKILVLLGDTPLITVTDIQNLLEKSDQNDLLVMGMKPPCPNGYGRLCTEKEHLLRIVENKDATELEKKIDLCNTGVMCFDGGFVEKNKHHLKPSPVTGEIYLTDLVQYAEKAQYLLGQWEHFRGINTRQELVAVEAALQDQFRERALAQGAYLMSPETTFLSYDTEFAEGVLIYPMVFCGPGVRLDSGVTIYSGSVLEGCHIQSFARVGPFARIRSGTHLGAFSEIGNFVETKNVQIGQYSQAKHLSYVGDAIIGDHVNIGAGVITCNYDGHVKKMTQLDDGVFVGSHTCLIAPVHIGKNSTIGAGSVITKSVEPEMLSLSRAPQKMISLSAGSRHLKRKKKGAPVLTVIS